jgi:drug/metabolite transporter (DMT)-like permease
MVNYENVIMEAGQEKVTSPPTTTSRPDVRVHAALLFVQLTFGGFSVLGKIVLGVLPPMALAGMRVLFAAPLLMLLALRRERRLPSFRDLGMLAVLGFTGVFINQILFIVGLHHTTAINASILMPSIPVFTVAVAMVTRVERPSARRLVGIGISVIGALTMLDITSFTFSSGTGYGNFLVLLNCLSYAVFLVLARPVLLRLPPLTVIAWTFALGGAGVAVLAAPTLATVSWAAIPSHVWLAVAYILLLPTLVNYLLNTWAIKRSSSSLVAAYTTLQPVAAGVFGVLLLGERITGLEVAGFCMIGAGLGLTSFTRTRDTSVPVNSDACIDTSRGSGEPDLSE